MLKKIISSIIIPAFLLQVVGCYSINEINRNDIALHNGKVQSAILTNGSKIRFEANSGRYFVQPAVIEGTDDLGIYRTFPLTNIRAVYKDRFKPVRLLLDSNLNIGIKYALLNDWTLLEFVNDSCKLDSNKNLIEGKIISSKHTEVNINDIKEVYVKAPDTLANYENVDSVLCLLTNDNTLINFEKGSVKYIPETPEIIGKTTFGIPVKLNLKDVESIAVIEGGSTTSSWIIAIGVGVLFIGAVIAAIAAGWSLDFNK